MSEQVTLADIARESGFSLATVSLALRNRPGVSEETRKRVLEVAAALGYELHAPETAPGPSIGTVGLLMKSEPGLPPSGGYFYDPVLAGIEEQCRHHRVNLFYAGVPVDAYSRALESPLLFTNPALDGLLLVGVQLDESLALTLSRRRLPLVLVDAYADAPRYDAVLCDNFQAAYTGVSYLIQRGHRHIALVGGGPQAYPSIADRYRGYQQALLDHGITAHYVADCPLRGSAALEATRALLEQHPEITAIFGCNDDVAIAAMQAARETGRAVPEQLSVLGFDDIELAQHVTPPLTTLRVDKVAMGQMAMQLLLWRAENLETPRLTVLIHPTLVERQSVCKVPTCEGAHV